MLFTVGKHNVKGDAYQGRESLNFKLRMTEFAVAIIAILEREWGVMVISSVMTLTQSVVQKAGIIGYHNSLYPIILAWITKLSCILYSSSPFKSPRKDYSCGARTIMEG